MPSQPSSVKLSKIYADPVKYQCRNSRFSQRSFDRMVSNFDPAKFDAMPAVDEGERFCVGGDGHSRFAALQELHKRGQLPKAWKSGADYLIPVRIVSEAEARKLAWTANLNADRFTPSEEAKVYKQMADTGMTAEQIAAEVGESLHYINGMLAVNGLCFEIREALGKSAAAGGLDVFTGMVIARGFQQYKVAPQQQQQLWNCVLKHANLNFRSARRFIDRIGAKLGDRVVIKDEVLFEIPPNAVAIVSEAKAHWKSLRSVRVALGMLIKASEDGTLKEYPELQGWLAETGGGVFERLADAVEADADMLADLVAPPKPFTPLPSSPTDARIARQYDAEATPCFAGMG